LSGLIAFFPSLPDKIISVLDLMRKFLNKALTAARQRIAVEKSFVWAANASSRKTAPVTVSDSSQDG
jgi:hypothetical protein